MPHDGGPSQAAQIFRQRDRQYMQQLQATLQDLEQKNRELLQLQHRLLSDSAGASGGSCTSDTANKVEAALHEPHLKTLSVGGGGYAHCA